MPINARVRIRQKDGKYTGGTLIEYKGGKAVVRAALDGGTLRRHEVPRNSIEMVPQVAPPPTR